MSNAKSYPLLPLEDMYDACPLKKARGSASKAAMIDPTKQRQRSLLLPFTNKDFFARVGSRRGPSSDRQKAGFVLCIGGHFEILFPIFRSNEYFIDDIAQLSDYVPKRKYAYLGRHFRTWISEIEELRQLGFELQQYGAVCLGDVIRMTEDEIMSRTTATHDTINVLKHDLARYGLKLGMKIPKSAPFLHWQR